MLVLGAFRCVLAFNHDSFMTSSKWLSPGTVDPLGMANGLVQPSFRAEQEPFHILKNHVSMPPCRHDFHSTPKFQITLSKNRRALHGRYRYESTRIPPQPRAK